MKAILICILASLIGISSIFAQESPSKTYVIEGKLNGLEQAYEGYVYLNYRDFKDSVKVINNSFTFTGSTEKPRQAWLHLEPDANAVWLYLENSPIEFEADFWKSEQNGINYNIMQLKLIKGSKSEDILSAFRKFSKENKAADDYPELIESYIAELIETYPKEPIVGKILADVSLAGDALSADQLKGLLGNMSIVHQQNSDIQIIQTALVSLESIKMGESFIAFNLPNPDGEEFSNDQLQGKYTLIDFWASWCAPCRDQNPKLTALLKEYKSRGFEIIGISIDRDPTYWKEAIQQDQLSWLQLIDKKEELQKKLGIQTIPRNYLLNNEGKVIGIDLPLEEVEKILEKELSL